MFCDAEHNGYGYNPICWGYNALPPKPTLADVTPSGEAVGDAIGAGITGAASGLFWGIIVPVGTLGAVGYVTRPYWRKWVKL